MNTTGTTTEGTGPTDPAGTTRHPETAGTRHPEPPEGGHDPRVGWSTTHTPPPPRLTARRDGILPAIAAALTLPGADTPGLTGTASRADRPPALHHLVQDFLDALPTAARDRFTGRCAEALLLSRHLTAADAQRSKRAQRKPMTNGEARKTLKNARLTTRHIREDGDPLHGGYAPPCRACTALAAHFGISLDDPARP
ncbi:YwqJ-related putative deaminase [Streptomyces sp. SCSIO ZS0520]|uniref:YwqJ-related putative deaminase n=1 Tax=Streptomyces sp. SCSIO ZS0520 TaxID=2892996 RepID=UPI0021D8F858|nr:YwqJ-related putative deaminase [Streptomyces sp. SCSIO ZS0520]